MLIRRAEQGDVKAICRVDARAFGNGSYAEARDKGNNPHWCQQRAQEIREWYDEHWSETYVALVNQKVVGFAGYRPFQGQLAIVDNNAVDPDYQSRGISTVLLKRVLQELQALGARTIQVETAHVPAAVRVYEKVGFRIVERHGPRTYLEFSRE